MPTYFIQKSQLGWIITKVWDTPGWLGIPCRVGGPYRTRKAAKNVARLLAGREAQVRVA